MMLEGLYQEIILDHYKHPHGRGLREPFGGEAHHVNPTCGDEITVRVAMSSSDISDISYDGLGCSISQASASVLHELLSGKDLESAAGIHEAFVEQADDLRVRAVERPDGRHRGSEIEHGPTVGRVR